MKKRNQLVSALLTGVLLGGAASGTIGTTPLRTAAEESSAGDESDYGVWTHSDVGLVHVVTG